MKNIKRKVEEEEKAKRQTDGGYVEFCRQS